jgi:hypothetical protein
LPIPEQEIAPQAVANLKRLTILSPFSDTAQNFAPVVQRKILFILHFFASFLWHFNPL